MSGYQGHGSHQISKGWWNWDCKSRLVTIETTSTVSCWIRWHPTLAICCLFFNKKKIKLSHGRALQFLHETCWSSSLVSCIGKGGIILELWQVEVDKTDFNGLAQTWQHTLKWDVTGNASFTWCLTLYRYVFAAPESRVGKCYQAWN